MTARSIRRAAEHKARKLAAKEARQRAFQSPEPIASPAAPFEEQEPPAVVPQEPLPADLAEVRSMARLLANRANAKRSTGPRTEAGRQTSSLNAVKTGLTGRTVLLSSDDAALYESHLREYRDYYQPQDLREGELVQSMADTQWRLRRIPGLEAAIYSVGSIEFADQFEDRDPEERAGLVQLETFFKYEKHLRNLQLQESRLTRRFEKEMKELRALQADRRLREERQAAAKAAVRSNNGFEFSNAAAASSRRTTAAPYSVEDYPAAEPFLSQTSEIASRGIIENA